MLPDYTDKYDKFLELVTDTSCIVPLVNISNFISKLLAIFLYRSSSSEVLSLPKVKRSSTLENSAIKRFDPSN